MTTRRPRLLIALLTTSLAACMARHAEPEETLADLEGISTMAPAATSADASGSETESATRADPNIIPGTGASAGGTAPIEQLATLGYMVAEDDLADQDVQPMPAPEASERSGRASAPRAARDAVARKDEARVTAGAPMPMRVPPPPPPQLAVGGPVTTTTATTTPIAGVVGTTSTIATNNSPATIDGRDLQTSTEEYTDYGVNGFTVVSQDALSTFSIDVDTASYTIARRKLNEGGLPPIAAVRVEEFVNYFDYDYAPPSASSRHPFNVHFEAFPDPFREGRHIMRVGVQAKEVPASERPPLHLTFLVDVSGSMSSSDKLPLAQTSLHMLVDSMQEGDTVALATYAGRIAEILPPTEVSNKRRIHDAISALQSGGSTAMASGMDLAYSLAQRSFEAGAENRVIVMSDGDANVGTSSWEDMLQQIKKHADSGVTMSTVGFGMGNYRDTLMEQLANKGDGNNFYIDSADQAQRVFVEQMGSTILTVARDVKLQVEFHDDAVSAYRLIGYENRDIADRDFRNDRVDAGEIGAGHNVTAIYEVILKEGYDDALATLRVRYEAPGADKAATETAMPFPEKALHETVAQTSREARIAYAAATFAEILRQSPHTNELSIDQLIAFTQQAARPGNKDDAELLDLMKKARRLGAGSGTTSVAGN